MSVPEESNAPNVLVDRAPLSLNQEFLCAFDKGDVEGAFGHRHTLVFGWRLTGEVDAEVLQDALTDVVARHEALRTSVVRGEKNRFQQIHPPAPPNLVIRDLSETAPKTRDFRAEEFLNEFDAALYNVQELPLLRAALGRFDDDDSVLVLSTHHTATDAWSMQLIIRDLAACYAARRGHGPLRLPAVRQYREFAAWQQMSPPSDASLGYWRDKLRDSQITAVSTDRPQQAEVTAAYAVHRFSLGTELTAATLKLSRVTRSSSFMILLAAYNILLRERTGVTDIVVPTFTSGRYQDQFQETVGPFFNMVPLRTDVAKCRSFREVVDQTRATCIGSYSHDIPFSHVVGESPEFARPFADPDRAVIAFEALQSPFTLDSELIGDLRYSDIRRRLLSQSVSSAIPNGGLWAMDVLPSEEMVGSLKFDSNLFDESTMVDMAAEFRRVLRNAVTDPDSPLRQL